MTDPTDPTSAPLDFQVDRDDFRACRCVPGEPIGTLGEGQVLFAVDRFALTSNNVSYAAAGDLLDYWGFFPGPGRWGRIPAMGFGDVVESRSPDVPVGTRCFGFFPMSRHLVIDARPHPTGVVDGAAHRAGHAPVYRTYGFVERDPLHHAEREDQIMLLRGLFMTSFLIDDLLDEKDFFGAERSILTSASSKTSIALAHLLHRRARGSVIGLTSARNRDFVERLGCYDEVVSYDALETLTDTSPAVLVDMAGNRDVVATVHGRLGDRLRYSCSVGATHWESKPVSEDLPGPTPEFFFAPARVVKRTEDWGGSGLQERLGRSWDEFSAFSDDWLAVIRHRGPQALERIYLDLLGGHIDPAEGHIVSL